MDENNARARRAKDLRYKRPALESMGWSAIWEELDAISEACGDIHWFIDQNDETLLNALDGDEDEAWEFKFAFADLEAKADQLGEALREQFGRDRSDDPDRDFDDCTVALIGDRYNMVGYDGYEEDYYSLTGYDRDLAQSEAGKRLMRKTKAEMISTIGQCVGTLMAFLDLRQSYDYLKATFDILRDENTSMLRQVKEIETAYEVADKAGWYGWKDEVKRYVRLLDQLPQRAWLE